MKENKDIQNEVLKECKERNITCTVFLMNGFQLQGKIADYDDHAVIVVTDAKQQMIYKHAISTITTNVMLKCIK